MTKFLSCTLFKGGRRVFNVGHIRQMRDIVIEEVDDKVKVWGTQIEMMDGTVYTLTASLQHILSTLEKPDTIVYA